MTNMDDMNSKYVTPKEFAEYFKIGRTTVLKYCREGTLKAVRIGEQYRIPSTEITRFERRLTNGE